MTRFFVYVFTVLLLFSCEETMKHIEVHGHRGCRGLLPENSLPAFEKAIELGVDVLEMDVVVSKDDVVVVSHEPFLNHEICLDLDGNEIPKEKEKDYNLYKMTFEEIQQFDCGTKFHPRFPAQEKIAVFKPALEQVFELAEKLNPEIKYNIELKAQPGYDEVYTPIPSEFVALVLKLINEYDLTQRTNLQSFDLRILEEIKKQQPNMKQALLVDENEVIEDKLEQLSFKPEIISPYYKLLNASVVKNYQDQGFQIIPWTVNEREELEEMLSFQVDAIITDYPDLLIQLK